MSVEFYRVSRMSVELYRESPGKFDSRTLNRITLNRWTGHIMPARSAGAARRASGNAVSQGKANNSNPQPPFQPYGRFPKLHRVFLGRDPGTLKSDIVSKNIRNQFVRI